MHYRSHITRCLTIFIASVFLFSTSLPVYAVGPTEPTGPQQTVGPTGPVGPQNEVGPGTAEESTVNTTTNITTGPESENTNTSTDTTTVEAEVSNTADITHTIDVDANSGGNTVSENTVTGDLTTGDIEGTVTLVNVANSQLGEGSSVSTQTLHPTEGETSLTLSRSTDRTSLANNETGNESENTNETNRTRDIHLSQTNEATIDNNVTINASTGNNTMSHNTQAGNLHTGDVRLGVNIFNIANVVMPNTVVTLDQWTLFEDYNGDIIIPQQDNTVTGPDSVNTNTTTTTQEVDLAVTNEATIESEVNVHSITGQNTIARNTVTGQAETGNTTVQQTNTTLANIGQPVVYLINVFGEWLGSFMDFGPNARVIVNQVNNETGEGSTNTNDSTDTTTVEVESENRATIRNNVAITAITGQNNLTDNTRAGELRTGNVSVYTNIVNIANSWGTNIANLNIGILNVFGRWNGNLRTQPRPSPSPLPSPNIEPLATPTPQPVSTNGMSSTGMGGSDEHSAPLDHVQTALNVMARPPQTIVEEKPSAVSRVAQSVQYKVAQKITTSHAVTRTEGESAPASVAIQRMHSIPVTQAAATQATTAPSQNSMQWLTRVFAFFALLWLGSEIVTMRLERKR